MRTLYRIAIPAVLAAAQAWAHAQLPFSIPGFGKGGSDGGGVNIGNVLANLNKAVREIDEPEEIRIGQEFAATLLGAKPLVADQAMQRYVNALGRWISLQTERPDLPWTFGVLDDPGFNAFATPGGYIFITKGLLERMRDEAELAGVLAHEIAHVLKKHHLRAVQKNAGYGLAAEFLSAKGGNNEARNALLNIGRKLYTSGLDQSDEFEADRMGVVIAARAGYDAYGLPSVLQMLQRQSASDNSFSLVFKTHPSPSARIQLLEKLMNDRFESIPAALGQPLRVRLTEFRK
jgi:beta-barrel assembly-enhancing protease